ncbi:hypothetical protein [Heyndrickxia sporothermodurans]|uniref:hypothetical protein n=1 Tax=Heyndrickxia sporothermodurans TaxID=46224 RepID=UPI000D3B1AFB|nr:hypothetical protein [Heyndrickxia sporothermodurans]PTY92871.1 hypothetical protein B5V90_01990 [Heyndrickxia sporothermodurans]
MFRTNSRIERKNGIRFYEQDILCSDYLFTNDLIVEMKLDYLTPGAGIVLLEKNELIEEQANDMFVFKVGQNDFTVIRRRYGVQEVVLHVSSTVTPPMMDLPLTFIKSGRSIELKTGDREVGHYMLPRSLDKYEVGFYSNAGNVLKDASFAAGAPNKWMVNIRNTNGGRVFFFKDGFQIEDCINDAEIEQGEVFLAKGKYHLAYDRSDIDGQNDIESFVSLSNDPRFDDKAKTLLDETNTFELEEDAYVNVKFKGTSGQITNIAIKDNTMDAYVPTDDFPITSTGSAMIITLDGLEKVTWKGAVFSVPSYDDLTDVRDYGIISSKVKNYLVSDFNLTFGREYTYVLDVESLRVDVYDGDDLHKTQVILMSDQDQGKLTVFRNINAIITQIIIKRTDGEEIDVLLQKTSKVYVPATIQGPVVVTDKYYIPMNLSSSYRISEDEGREDVYLFTNWEREIFNPAEKMVLDKAIIDMPGNIKVYGILKDSETNLENFYRISGEIDTIDLYADKYDVITESLFTIDYYNSQIKLDDEIKDQYKEIVIDYLKEGSYCINYDRDLHSYEVDISTSEETIYVMYDYAYDEQGYGTVSEYQITDIKPGLKNKFVVLRKN